jgi:uncharacterized membrane protein
MSRYIGAILGALIVAIVFGSPLIGIGIGACMHTINMERRKM